MPKKAGSSLTIEQEDLLNALHNFLTEVYNETSASNFTDRAGWSRRSKRLLERIQEELA